MNPTWAGNVLEVEIQKLNTEFGWENLLENCRLED